METKLITRINNVDIVSTSDEQMVPIRPICEALGIDPEGQRQRISRDAILSSVAFMVKATGADGKTYEMYALPYKYIFGWLFSIDSSKIKEQAMEAVLHFQKECYDALFDHFMGRMSKVNEQNKIEIKLLEEIDMLNEQCAEHKNQLAELKHQVSDKRKLLEQARTERLNDEPTLFG